MTERLDDRALLACLDAYAGFWDRMTPATVPEIAALITPDMRFIDPFNDLTGLDRIQALLRHTLSNTEDLRVTLLDRGLGAALPDGGRRAFLYWRFAWRHKGRPIEIVGTSLIILTADGLVARHEDFWDPAVQLYERVPVLGAVLRAIRRRLALR